MFAIKFSMKKQIIFFWIAKFFLPAINATVFRRIKNKVDGMNNKWFLSLPSTCRTSGASKNQDWPNENDENIGPFSFVTLSLPVFDKF